MNHIRHMVRNWKLPRRSWQQLAATGDVVGNDQCEESFTNKSALCGVLQLIDQALIYGVMR